MPILDDLKTYGYSVQRNTVPRQTCERFAARLDEIEAHKRKNGTLYDVGIQAVIYNLFEEDADLFLPLIDGEPIFPEVQQILGNGQQITLNSLSASRSIRVNHEPEGDPWKAHIDARMPAPDFGHTESIVAMTCLDDFTSTSGATRLWPYSHLSGSRPPLGVDTDKLPGAVQVEAPRGSVIYWLGQTWHAISKNLSGVRRWGLIHHYTYWWIKPTFDYTFCGAGVYKRLTTRQKAILGFNSRPPVSADLRVFTVTDAEKLPDNYEAAMRIDYAKGHAPATAHRSADTK
jgi:ectoine hydroxylase-related dioxygenase (phytanoyl-CoA dioxygenase family)